MKFTPTDCKECFEYSACLKGENKYCIIYEETLEPFTMIRETCKAFNPECDKCPIRVDCSKWDIDQCTPLDWYNCKKEGI